MGDLLKDFQQRAIRSRDYCERNNHKYSATNTREHNDDSLSSTD